MRLVVLGLVLALAACSTSPAPTPPVPPPVPVVTPPAPPSPPPNVQPIINDACDVYRTISWAIPLVEDLAGKGKLSPTAQSVLADANTLVAAGCQADDATWQVRAADVANALVVILYQTK